jgi:hypothetical protein
VLADVQSSTVLGRVNDKLGEAETNVKEGIWEVRLAYLQCKTFFLGIQINLQPPGKKNQSHMIKNYEKDIKQMNCMLKDREC